MNCLKRVLGAVMDYTSPPTQKHMEILRLMEDIYALRVGHRPTRPSINNLRDVHRYSESMYIVVEGL